MCVGVCVSVCDQGLATVALSTSDSSPVTVRTTSAVLQEAKQLWSVLERRRLTGREGKRVGETGRERERRGRRDRE